MSSARMLMATVAFGLAACAYTPSKPTAYFPDVNLAAPVLQISAEIPAGFNDHVVIIVDHEGIARAVSSDNGISQLQQYGLSAYTYRHHSSIFRAASPTASVPADVTSGSAMPQVYRPTRRVNRTTTTDNSSRQRSGRYKSR